MAQVVDDPIAAGREAARRHDWPEAYELFSSAEGALSATDLEQLADAAYFSGRLSESLTLRERIYREHLGGGNNLGAAAAAVRLSFDYMMKGVAPLSNGWPQTGPRPPRSHQPLRRISRERPPVLQGTADAGCSPEHRRH